MIETAFLAALMVLQAETQPDDAALRSCAGKPDAERLACYDAVLRAQTSVPAPRSMSPEEIEAQARAAAQGTAIAPPGSGSASEPTARPPAEARQTQREAIRTRTAETDALPHDVPVQAIEFDPYETARVTLATGEVWQQLSSDGRKLRPSRRVADAGLRATVRRGALGSYRMRIEPLGKTIRVRREG